MGQEERAGAGASPSADRDLAGLATELEELARRDPEQLKRRLAGLSIRRQAELALRLAPQQRLELLLHAPRPMRLVRSLPDGDFYLTVREIGPADAAPLLRLGSARQLHHLLDLESWRRDRFDPERCGAWVAMFLEAGEPAIRRFLKTADDELLALLFHRWIRVEQLEYEDGAEVHGHGVSEAGTEQGFVTPDGYHRFLPVIADHVAAIRRLLQLFYREDPTRYQRILWASRWELASELEEQALQWRQSRLEEHGFPRWEEALAVYATPSGELVRPTPPAPADPDGLGSERLLLDPGRSDVPTIAQAIDGMDEPLREKVLHEVVALANQLLVADGGDTGNPEVHRRALRKAGGYVGIALRNRGADVPATAGRVLAEVPLVELFREGYAVAVELQRRARNLVEEGWPAGDAGRLEQLDAPIGARVLALLEPRPRYFVPAAEGRTVELREFRSADELQEARVALEMAEFVGDLLLGRLRLDVAPTVPLSTGLLTLLGWHAARGEVRGDPLPADVVADFLRTIASRRTAPPEAPGRALEMLTRTLAERFELAPREVALLQAFGRFCLERLADECAALDPGVPVDPRYVSCMLVAG